MPSFHGAAPCRTAAVGERRLSLLAWLQPLWGGLSARGGVSTPPNAPPAIDSPDPSGFTRVHPRLISALYLRPCGADPLVRAASPCSPLVSGATRSCGTSPAPPRAKTSPLLLRLRSLAAGICLAAFAALPAFAQDAAPAAAPPVPVVIEVPSSPSGAPEPPAGPSSITGSGNSLAAYVLGPDDQITIRAVDADELGKDPVRIDMSGYLRLPMVGRIRAAGLTVEQLQAEIVSRLREYIKDPDVAVSVTDFRSQPVSVIGAVKNPGVHQLQGRKTLVEILSLAGGLSDDAGYRIKITRSLDRGPIPLAGAETDPSGAFSVAQVSLKDLMEARNPADNILIQPHDVISVPRAELVYVVGQVAKSGGFVLHENQTISALQALSLAGGLDKTASAKNARILRTSPGDGSRREIRVNLALILKGRSPDVPMQPNDILFVPTAGGRAAFLRALQTATNIGSGVIIYR